jgi:hypothetical protein
MASQSDASNTNPADPTVQLPLTYVVKVHQVNVLGKLCWSHCTYACFIFKKTNERILVPGEENLILVQAGPVTPEL